MATDADRLRASRSNYLAQLERLSDPDAPKVTYSAAGRSFNWNDYQKFLLDQIRAIDVQLGSDDPGELVTALR